MSESNDPTVFLVSSIDVDRERGDTIHTKTLYRKLNELNKTYLFAYSNSGETEDEQILLYPMYSIPVKYLRTLSAKVIKFIFLIICTIKIRPDVFYIRSSPIGFVPAIVAKIFRKPIVLEVNGLFTEEGDIKETGPWIKKLIYFVERFNYWAADEIVAVTPEIAEYVCEGSNKSKKSVHVVQNGVDTNLMEPLDQQSCRAEVGVKDEKDVVLFLGNLERWQGVDDLLSCIPTVREDNEDLLVLIVGDGPMKQELSEMSKELGIDDIVEFTGRVPHRDVPTYINASDICIVYKKPLESGYSPLKLYEYLACSKPVIASDVKGFEFLEKIGAGLAITPENPDKLAEGLQKLLSDPEKQVQYGKKGRKYVLENHSWESVAEEVHNIIENSQGSR